MNRFTIALLGTALVLLLAVEVLTRVTFDRNSKVQRHEMAQRRAVLSVNDTAATHLPHVVVLGNSLLLDGIDVQTLVERTKTEVVPIPYFVLATDYYDWYFALKRLFAEGMKPRYILLGLSPNQLASSHSRGEYSAQYLFREEDLIEVARKTHMDATTASSFFLAHYSKYYSTRQITRGYIFSQLLPGVAEMMHEKLGVFRDPPIPEDKLSSIAKDRLKSLDILTRANGAQFMLVVPPTYQSGPETIQRAGKELGIPVLVPVPNGEFDGSFFQSDGIHLNEKGAATFTNRLASDLESVFQAGFNRGGGNPAWSFRGNSAASNSSENGL